MSTIALLAIVCGMAAAVAWGVADFLAAKASRSVGPVSSVMAVNIVGAVGFGLLYAISGQGGFTVDTATYYAIAAGIGLGLGQITFFQALNAGPVSLVSPLSSAYPLITTLAVMVFLSAQLTARQLVGIGLVMLGILIASELFSISKQDRKLSKGPILALITAVLWGIGYTLSARALETQPWQVVSLIQLCAIAIVCVACAPLLANKEPIFTRSNLALWKNPYIVATGLIQMFGMVIISFGIEKDTNLTPIVTAISACYPVLTMLLALTRLKERVQLLPLGGAALTIVGVIILSLG